MANVTVDLERAREYFKLGEAEADKNNYEQAIEYYTKSLEAKSDYIPSLFNRAVMYHNIDAHGMSLEGFKAALNAELSKPEPREEQIITIKNAIAGAYFFLGDYRRLTFDDYEKAIEYYSLALEIDPNFCDAIKSLGLAQSQMGLFEESIQNYNKVIELDPNYERIYQYRAMSYMDLDENELALKDINKQIEFNPDDIESFALRGIIEYDLGLYEDAIKDLTLATGELSLKPLRAKAYFFRSHAFKELGNTELADKDLQKAIELDPEYANCK